MGLSATPYDQFEGAKEKRYLEDYFGKIVSTYSIGEAIKDKWLTKYEYHVVETYMNDNELKEYEDLSESIRKLQGDDPDMAAIKAIKLFERARLIGSIEDKLHKLKDIIREKTANTLVYCGDAKDDFGLKQIENVSKIFNERGWNTGKITADESPKERKKTIENLKDGLIDIIVSIRVLDEGVNIPSVERAYILASRRSEREYIQRRGRVLRLSNNKDKAIIYDFVVMGAFSSSKNFNNLHKAEFERVRTFAKDASNKDSLYIKYENYFNLLDEDD